MESNSIETNSFIEDYLSRVNQGDAENNLFLHLDTLDISLLTVLNLLSKYSPKKTRPKLSVKLSKKIEDVCLLYPELKSSMEVLIDRIFSRN